MTNSISSEGVGREIDALLFALTRQLSSYREAQLAPFDLTYPQAQVLCSLTIPLPMNELADRLHCTGSNVTGIVDRLEARGLLQRRAFAADRRVKQLALTDAGVTLQREVDAIMSAFPSSTAGSHTDLLQMRDLLRRFLGRMLEGTPHVLTTGAWAREQNCREGHCYRERVRVQHVSRLPRAINWSPQRPNTPATQRKKVAIEMWYTERWPTLRNGRTERDAPSSASTNWGSISCRNG